jgi:outer membrane protein OmpA-like peptidoglycan-associated protein
MKIFRTLILGLVLSATALTGQTEAGEVNELFATRRYSTVMPLLMEMIKKDPENAKLNYMIGICYLNSRSQKPKALDYLEKSVKNSTYFYTHGFPKESDAPLLAYKVLGDAYEMAYRFDEAITSYKKYREAVAAEKNPDPSAIAAVERQIEFCDYGKKVSEIGFNPTKDIAKSRDQILKNIADLQNCEYTSAISPDKTFLIYTIKIPLKKQEDKKFFEDGIISKPDTQPLKKAPGQISKKTEQEHDTIIYLATVGTSVDGQVMLTYKDEKGDGSLYVSRLQKNKWSKPLKLAKTINEHGWEPDECVSADGNYLYFVSNREGGYGGKDIYLCKKLPNGEWGKAKNLGPPVNSAFDDEAPFFHTDNQTLYFSSNRNKPATCFDLYSVNMIDSLKWSKPQLVGYPINSSDDNSFYQVAVDKKRLFTAGKNSPTPESDQARKENKKNSAKKNKKDSLENVKNERDNYLISFINQNKAQLTLLKGEVIGAEEQVIPPVKVTIVDNENGTVLGTYHSDSKTGCFVFPLPSGKNNSIVLESEGYLPFSDNFNTKNRLDFFEKQEAIEMRKIEKNAKVPLKNIFFESDKASLTPESKVELNRIYAFLTDNPALQVKINNYIITRENTKHNKRLSEERAIAIENYLVEKGLDRNRISSEGYRKSKLPTEDKKEPEIKTMVKKEIPALQLAELEIDKI